MESKGDWVYLKLARVCLLLPRNGGLHGVQVQGTEVLPLNTFKCCGCEFHICDSSQIISTTISISVRNKASRVTSSLEYLHWGPSGKAFRGEGWLMQNEGQVGRAMPPSAAPKKARFSDGAFIS